MNSSWLTILTPIDLKMDFVPLMVINNSHLTQLFEINQWQVSKVLQSALGMFLGQKIIFIKWQSHFNFSKIVVFCEQKNPFFSIRTDNGSFNSGFWKYELINHMVWFVVVPQANLVMFHGLCHLFLRSAQQKATNWLICANHFSHCSSLNNSARNVISYQSFLLVK